MSKSLTTIFTVIATLAIISTMGCDRKEEMPVEPLKPDPRLGMETIAAVGNSLTEGQGVAEAVAYPALLERKLADAGYPYRVVNAGIGGETSSATLSRIKWVLTLNPRIVILETGANDGFRGIDPRLTEQNILAIVRTLQEHHVTVVLAGMLMVGNMGDEYTNAFAKIYPSVARQTGSILMPFFLEGVAGEPSKNQPDGIHPTAEGYEIIVDALFPFVLEAIKRVESAKDSDL